MFLGAVGSILAATAQKPKIILFPSDDWCMQKGYMLDAKTPDYEKALQDSDMDGAIAVMGDIMAEMGYPMFSLKQELKDIHTMGAYDMAVTSKADGMIMESDRDKVTRNVGADLSLSCHWSTSRLVSVAPSSSRRRPSTRLPTRFSTATLVPPRPPAPRCQFSLNRPLEDTSTISAARLTLPLPTLRKTAAKAPLHSKSPTTALSISRAK